jgi:serine/threonine-protein kinase
MASSDPAATASQILSRMADSLSTTLLVRLGRVTRVAAVRRAGVGCPTSSESAKHRYLQAEQFFRQSVWDSAFVAYRDVVASDTSCALAYHRLADVAAWAGSAADSVAQAYQLKAGAHNHGLPLRDSLLITVDSLDVALRAFYDERVPGTRYWRTVRRMFATLDEAKRRYPEDPEVWYAAGDASYHWGWGNAGLTPSEILEQFDRAIRIDPGFVLSYLHAIELAFALGDTARANRYLGEYTAHRPAGTVDWVGFTMRLIDPRTAFSAETVRDLTTQSMEDLLGARLIVDRWPDSLESAVRISWQMDTRETRDSARVADCGGGHDPKWVLAQRLAFRGHLRAAVCALGPDLGEGGSLVTDLALLGAIPDETAQRVFDGWLARGSSSLVHALPWWSGRRDTVRLGAAARVADSIARRAPDEARREEATYTGASARAHLALARVDTAGALQRFRSLPDTLCIECFLFDRWTTARLLAARDSLDAASAVLSQWIGEDAMAREVPMALDRARVADRRGDRERAIAAYRWVVGAWRRGDEAVQPLVAEARAALARLGT